MISFSYALRHNKSFKTLHKTWPEFVDFLHSRFVIERHPSQKENSECIGAFILKDEANGWRTIANVSHCSSFIAFDLDTRGWLIEEITDALNGDDFGINNWDQQNKHALSGLDWVAHTTASSQNNWQRWRIIIRLDREITKAEHRSVWNFFNTVFLCDFDKQTTDCSRISYVPHDWIGADAVFHNHHGKAFPVEVALRFSPPVAVLPKPVAQTVMTGAFAPAGTDIITPKMRETYFSTPRGGRFYKMMCGAALRYKDNGWLLTAEDLATAALAVSPKHHTGKDRNALHDAKNALAWAETEYPIICANREAEQAAKIAENEADQQACLARWGIK